MALRSKPQQSNDQPDQKKIDRLIEKGGSIAVEEPEADTQNLTLRIERSMVKDIDGNLKRRYPHKETRPSRHAWFIQAFREKLEREA